MNEQTLRSIREQLGTPSYVYDLDAFRKRADMVRRCAEEPYYPALLALIVAVMKDEGNATGVSEGD